jgi:hypothetical protein
MVGKCNLNIITPQVQSVVGLDGTEACGVETCPSQTLYCQAPLKWVVRWMVNTICSIVFSEIAIVELVLS